MGKKKVVESVYPEAPLIIAREKFCQLLSEQIAKGNELLNINVPQKTSRTTSYGGFVSMQRITDRVEYDDESKKDFIANYNKWNDRNKTIYRTSFEVPESIYFHEYESHIWQIWGSDIVKEYKDEIQRLVSHMQGDIERSDLMQCVVAQLQPMQTAEHSRELSQEIFIVHGHNEEMKQTVARIVSKMGLKPIILHEQPDSGLTILEKIERYADVDFAVVLYTECDLGRAKEKDQKDEKYRARQNVVFEHGYLIGKLGRDHVCALVKGNVETPGDISGVVYVSMDSAGAWKMQLGKNMKAVGLPADLNTFCS